MPKPTISDEPREIPDWFNKTRRDLLETWTRTTGHGVKLPSNGWACEIGRGCESCTDHLSIPCSLALEAREIALLLNKEWKEEHYEFALFFRLYLVVLSEFVRNLAGVTDLLKLKKIPKKMHPDNVTTWCNNFAKHRRCMLIQHHPDMIVADAYGPAWPEFEKRLPTAVFTDQCGTRRPIQIIDQKWFNGNRSKDTAGANARPQAIIVVPPLMEFLQSTMVYFRAVVDECCSAPERVKQFESEHFATRCP